MHSVLFSICLVYSANGRLIDLFWFCPISVWPIISQPEQAVAMTSNNSCMLETNHDTSRPERSLLERQPQRSSQNFVWWSTHQTPLLVGLQSGVRSAARGLHWPVDTLGQTVVVAFFSEHQQRTEFSHNLFIARICKKHNMHPSLLLGEPPGDQGNGTPGPWWGPTSDRT